MSIRSESVLTPVPPDGKPNLLSGAALENALNASTALYDLVEVSATEVKPHVSSVPNTRYHVRVELEDGTDRYLSFNAEFIRETDERDGSPVEYYDLYRLHLDGQPCTVADVDGLFEGGLNRLATWLLEEREADRADRALEARIREAQEVSQ
jgi:hypothetical protein